MKQKSVDDLISTMYIPPLLMDMAKQMLDSYKGIFKQEKKKLYNSICLEVHKYFADLFKGMNIDETCEICDMQDDMANALKQHVDTLNYSFQSALMSISQEKRKIISDMSIVRAVIHVSDIIVFDLIGTHDTNLHRANSLCDKFIAEICKEYTKVDLGITQSNIDQVKMAMRIFVNKVRDYKPRRLNNAN